MCGITGILNFSNSTTRASEHLVESMTKVLQHRGPDDSGVYVNADGTLGLGFRRLSIIDLSEAGHQPMSADDGNLHVVFNGEIYNHRRLRSELTARGYCYRSETDTESILYAYQEWGTSFVSRLYGMFAIAIWDARKNTILLARDRIGIKPLYYYLGSDFIVFASEIKAILKHPLVPCAVDDQALADYLSLMMVPGESTMFRGIRKLAPGNMLTVDSYGDAAFTTYWDLNHRTENHAPSDLGREDYCVENVRRLLRDSISDRMMSDVPFGVLLSGGIDSSLNVALMAELMDRPVQTFSVGHGSLQKYDELKYARQVANQFGTEHHEMMLEERDVIDFLPKMVWHQDEPNGDPVCAPMYFVSKLARDSGTIVVQVGEGSDEQFVGYQHYLKELQYFQWFYRIVPSPVAAAAFHASKTLKPYHLGIEYLRRAARRDQAFHGGALAFSEHLKGSLLNREFRSRVLGAGRIAQKYAIEALNSAVDTAASDYLRSISYIELKSRLADLLLMRVDKMSMAASVEARVPFLDHRLVEFTMQIPWHLKIKGNIPKYILKRAAEGILPENIIYRRKQGFAAPIAEWLRAGRLRLVAREVIFESPLVRTGPLVGSFIDTLFRRHSAGRMDHSVQIWNLVVLCQWYDTYASRGR